MSSTSESNTAPRYLVTSALPYANGPIHFGHIAGAYLPADIFVRFLRLKKADVIYICGTDEYGAAITLNARKEGISPKELTDKYHRVIVGLFEKMQVEFDNFSRTTWPRHIENTQRIFLDLLKNGYVLEKTSQQQFCTHCNMFLPDRYIVGTCYNCGHEQARGDECPACGTWIDPLKLINPSCKMCGRAGLEVRETRHWYLDLPKLSPKLKEWLGEKTWWKKNVLNFIQNMIDQGLDARPITRDLDWGVPVPLEGAEGKVLYVWFDAPIGYLSSTMEWSERRGEPNLWQDYWYNSECRMVHFIGKDNIPFHTIVWPGVLMGQDQPLILPYDVPANEFYNLEGAKFNTSTGWYIDVEDFFSKYQSDSIRYCIARNAPENSDSEFAWRDFQAKHNGELADIYGNLAARTFKFIHRYFDGRIPAAAEPTALDRETLAKMAEFPERVGHLLLDYRVREAAQEFMNLARLGNRYIDSSEPWKTRKTDPEQCGSSLRIACRLLAELAVLSYPFIPQSGTALWRQLRLDGTPQDQSWDDAAEIELPQDHPIGEAEIMFNKLTDEQIEAEIEALKARSAAQTGASTESHDAKSIEIPPIKATITYDEFAKLDMRVGEILAGENVPKSNKLLRLEIDLGCEKRQILAGIAQFYTPDQLVGRKVIVLANLAPRKLMGMESQGMLLAASLDSDLAALTIDNDRWATLPNGSPVS